VVITFVVLTLIDWLWLFEWPPVFAGVGWFGFAFFNLFVTLVIFVIADSVTHRFSLAPVVAVIAILVMVGALFWNSLPLKGASNIFGHLAHVTMEPLKAYPPTSNANIITVSDQNALQKADQALGRFIPGTRYTLGSRYALTGDCFQKPVNGHNYYICPLTLSGSSNNQADKYTVIAYIAMDAENPDAQATVHWGYKMKWTPGAPYGHSMTRLIWNWDRSVYIDDLTLEVDNNWQPMYTATIDRPATKLQQSVPVGFITVDPQTGKITRYPLNRVPGWVARVYSATMAVNYLNWWGKWGVVPWNVQGSGGRYQVDGSSVEQVYTDHGPAWQALMTPTTSNGNGNNTTAVAYIALMSTRTGDVRMYTAPQGLTTQSSVDHAIGTSANNLKGLDAANKQLHRVDGELVWIAPLVPHGSAGSGNPEPSTGVAILDATDSSGTHVIIGQNEGDALQQLGAQIATGAINNIPGSGSHKTSVAGVLSAVGSPLPTAHGTFIAFTIGGDKSHVYSVQVTGTDIGNLELTLMHAGQDVVVTFYDTGQPIGYHPDSSVKYS
jgi:hypothetical protein